MNFVICKHQNDSGKYLFRAPDGVKMIPGTVVGMDTQKGRNQLAVCVSSSFESDDVDMICELHGTQPGCLKKIKYVYIRFQARYTDEVTEDEPFT